MVNLQVRIWCDKGSLFSPQAQIGSAQLAGHYATFALNTQIRQVRCFVLDFATLKLTLRLEHCFNPFSVWMPKKQIFKYLKCVHYRITDHTLSKWLSSSVLLHSKEVSPRLRLVKSDYKSGVQFHMYLELNRTIVQSHGSRFRLKSNQAWVGLVPRISRLLIKNKYSKMCIEWTSTYSVRDADLDRRIEFCFWSKNSLVQFVGHVWSKW